MRNRHKSIEAGKLELDSEGVFIPYEFDDILDGLGDIDVSSVLPLQKEWNHGSASIGAVQLSMKQVFTILYDALNGEIDQNIPFRPSASPIDPNVTCFYVWSSSDGAKTKKKKRKLGSTAHELISVKYQGFHPQNSEVWWSPQHDNLVGVVSRAMSKKARKNNSASSSIQDSSENDRNHGFSGYWFSLVHRSEEERDVRSTTASNFKSLLVENAPSLVQFWKVYKRKPGVTMAASDDKGSVISNGSSTTFTSSTGELSSFNGEVEKCIRSNLRIEGDLFVTGDTSVRNLHVLGNLLVEGNISGQLVTPPGAADYAEWFPMLDPSENIKPGMVIQLRSPQQKITLNTSGSGPHMVVSTTPSVAAGVPPTLGDAEPIPGCLCAFMGQVPVKVIGPVQSGELLFPSDGNDGFAVVAGFKEFSGESPNEPIGTAMTSCGKGKHTILAFIRWQHNLDYYTRRHANTAMYKQEPYIWMLTALSMGEKLISLGYFYYRPYLYFEMLLSFLSVAGICNAVLHNVINGKYGEFILRGDVLLYIVLSLVRVVHSFWTICKFAATGSVEQLPACVISQLIIMLEVGFVYCAYSLMSLDFWETKYEMSFTYRKISPIWIWYDWICGRVSVVNIEKCGE